LNQPEPFFGPARGWRRIAAAARGVDAPHRTRQPPRSRPEPLRCRAVADPPGVSGSPPPGGRAAQAYPGSTKATIREIVAFVRGR